MGNGMGNSNMGNFGFSNEDRRGFALPERQMFPNDMPPMFDDMSSGGGGGGWMDNRGGNMGGGSNYMGGPGGMSQMRGGSGGGGMSSFDRKPMGLMDEPNEMFNRRPQM